MVRIAGNRIGFCRLKPLAAERSSVSVLILLTYTFEAAVCLFSKEMKFRQILVGFYKCGLVKSVVNLESQQLLFVSL